MEASGNRLAEFEEKRQSVLDTKRDALKVKNTVDFYFNYVDGVLTVATA